jgi:peptidyl-tRNA hydrolase
MQKPETKLKNKIYDFLETEIGGYWIKMSGSAYIRRGLPDIIGFPPSGFFAAIEVKTPTGKLSKLQEHILDKINLSSRNTVVLVFFKFEKVEQELLKSILLTKH